MSNRYDTNSQNTSKFMQDMINEFNKMPRGAFNENCRKIFDIGMYDIVPIDCWEMLPNSEAYLTYDIQMLTKNPTIKRLLSSMRVELRVYKCNYNDLWAGWNNFITKGRSGKVAKSIPALDWSLGNPAVTTCLPYNPAFYLNLAPAAFCSKEDIFSHSRNGSWSTAAVTQPTGLTGLSTIAQLKQSKAMRISALPFVMYNKIAKKYLSPNLLQDNPYWFPENEDHDMYLPYDCPEIVTNSVYSDPGFKFVSNFSIAVPSASSKKLPSSDEVDYQSRPWLNTLYKAQRKGDYFNTGSPFPDLIRGDVPTLQLLNASLSPISANVDFSDIFNLDNEASLIPNVPFINEQTTGISVGRVNLTTSGSSNYVSAHSNPALTKQFRDLLNSATVNISQPTLKGVQFSMRQWRQLATMTVMRERMALTDGSYNELIKAMFGHNPQYHSHDVVYCGGDTQPIVFSEVINTSASDSNPLGETGGRAFTSQNGKTIHVTSDDFGMFMTVLVITGDEVYSQGVNRMFSRLENSEQYFPILNNLSPDATLNRELYVSGDDTVDNDVFNYQERFAYYKSRQNKVSGLMALPISKVGDVGAYLQNRLFSSTPNFNQEFSYGKLTDNEKLLFTSTNQAEFVAVVGCQMKYIAPIPEDSRPSDMGISY